MDVRPAYIGELPELKAMFREITDHMNHSNVRIWDEIYPYAFLEEDIRAGRLYILKNGDDIAAAFALCESNEGEPFVKWENADAKALYIDRLGVNVKYLRQGLGRVMLRNAAELAFRKNAEYLRLFVVDINEPAVHLYRENGFAQAEGIYEEKFDDFVLREYGFEKRL